MIYNYPFFSFPNLRRFPSYYSPYYSNSQFSNTNKAVSINTTPSNFNNTLANRNNYVNTNHSNFTSNTARSAPAPSHFMNQANYQNRRMNGQIKQESHKKETKKEENHTKKNISGFHFLDNFLNQEDRGEDEKCFELFGLKLYHDDLLLIGLIFFLYQEDVKDQYLFIALILLLLS